jgi:hypothetical protein
MGRIEPSRGFVWENLEGGDSLEDPSLGERIILKYIMQ